MLDVTIARASLPSSGALLLPVEEGGSATAAAWAELDAATGGAISRALETAEFKGRKGQTVTILAPGAGLSRVVAVGLGKLTDLTPLVAEEAGGAGIAPLGHGPWLDAFLVGCAVSVLSMLTDGVLMKILGDPHEGDGP